MPRPSHTLSISIHPVLHTFCGLAHDGWTARSTKRVSKPNMSPPSPHITITQHPHLTPNHHTSQAGVIAARGGKAGNGNVKLDLHKHFAEMWLKRAADWRSGVRDGPYTVDADLHPLRNAFKMIDTNGSETIGTSELASVLKAMGTR
eukprot:362608-Chlamydomonas_euryale.AAC.7